LAQVALEILVVAQRRLVVIEPVVEVVEQEQMQPSHLHQVMEMVAKVD
jgi:hypothetical protein